MNQWHRVHPDPKEKAHEFVKRVQCHPLMDVCVGLHWVAIDQVKDTGEAEFSARGLWNVTDEALRQARVKMNRLGYFKVESSRESGKPARYILDESRFATAEAEQDTKRVEQTKEPTLTWTHPKQRKRWEQEIARQEEEHRQREAWERTQKEEKERAEQQSREELAASEGVTLEGKRVRDHSFKHGPCQATETDHAGLEAKDR